jgi:hypothetical protein
MEKDDPKRQARSMISLTFPALLIGAGCSLILLAVMGVAESLQAWLWQTLPAALGVAATNRLWPLAPRALPGLAALVTSYPCYAS